jgi:omega-hydroxy-beta-dihydromenaquinone-9 sulfotransferase
VLGYADQNGLARVVLSPTRWPGRRRAPSELLGVSDFATRSVFQSHSLEHRDDQFDRGTREFVERTLDGVIPAMGYA